MDRSVEIAGTLTGALVPTGMSVTGGLTIPEGMAVQVYDGAYEITPLTETETVMETAGKRMADDVVVLAIPYYETTNESGGYTVNIG